jgi:hypothetical protein
VLFSKINLSLEQSPDEDKKSKINIQHMQKTSFSLDQSPHMDKKVQKKPQYKRETSSCLDTTQFQDLAKSGITHFRSLEDTTTCRPDCCMNGLAAQSYRSRQSDLINKGYFIILNHFFMAL